MSSSDVNVWELHNRKLRWEEQERRHSLWILPLGIVGILLVFLFLFLSTQTSPFMPIKVAVWGAIIGAGMVCWAYIETVVVDWLRDKIERAELEIMDTESPAGMGDMLRERRPPGPSSAETDQQRKAAQKAQAAERAAARATREQG